MPPLCYAHPVMTDPDWAVLWPVLVAALLALAAFGVLLVTLASVWQG